MSEHADYLYALEVQKQWNSDRSLDEDIQFVDFKAPAPSKKPLQIKRSNPHSNLDEEFLNRTQNLVHPLWETLDPTPDVNSLFTAFDAKFFQQRLKCVQLEWSKRMYSCAGICYSSKNRYGMSIVIRLSEPLLKLRPRKDLVETMLHEMIHAYCFVLNIREGNGGHGPNFKKIMHSINKVAGTNITVYHTFHDEVDLYKQHWWRCNGVCQNRSPFFGYVKRTCNRAPSANDQWWAVHHQTCGGTFMKIKGPDLKKPPKSSRAKENKPLATGSPDLRNFFPTGKKDVRPTATNAPSSVNAKPSGSFGGSAAKSGTKTNGGGTILLNPKVKPPTSAFPPTSYPSYSTPNTPSPSVGGNLRNVMTFGDLNRPKTSDNAGGSDIITIDMTGRGYTMPSNGTVAGRQSTGSGLADRNLLREVWSKRFTAGGNTGDYANSTTVIDLEAKGDAKRRRLSAPTNADVQFVADEAKKNKNDWIILDDDVALQERDGDEVIALSSDDDDDNENNNDDMQLVPRFKQRDMTANERQTFIKQEILDETSDLRDEDIILIDDEYDDNDAANDLNLSTAAELADTSIIDEFFGSDSLLEEFTRENDVMPSGSRYVHDPQDDIITCPVCMHKMKRCVLSEHLDGCTGITVQVTPRWLTMKKLEAVSKEARPKAAAHKRKSKRDILRDAGYSDEDLQHLDLSSSTDDEAYFRSVTVSSTPGSSPPAAGQMNDDWLRHRQRNLLKTTRQCPRCGEEVEEDDMVSHLDDCRQQRRRH